jgi:peroxiredoxin Q/BCP
MTFPTRRAVLRASALVVGAALGGVFPRGARAVDIGQRAPDFTLPATTGGQIGLAQLRGKPVLIEFYGADFAPV